MAFVQDISLLFSDAYATMVAQRATLGLSALQPSALTNFQIGPEYLEQEQSSPRIVIVPVDTAEFGFAQPLPATQTATQIGRNAQKSLYTGVEAFEAHIWGDPDPANSLGYYSFNSTMELRREFIGALYTVMMGGTAPRGSFTPMGGRWQVDPRGVGMVNTSGRLYVLTFHVAMPVVRDAYTSLAYSTVKGDGKVVREIVQQVADPVTGANPVVIPPTIEVP